MLFYCSYDILYHYLLSSHTCRKVDFYMYYANVQQDDFDKSYPALSYREDTTIRSIIFPRIIHLHTKQATKILKLIHDVSYLQSEIVMYT